MSHVTDKLYDFTSDTRGRARGFTDRALGSIGLARKSGPLDALLVLGAGLLVGGVAVALFTPVSGPELRRRIGGGLSRLADVLAKKEAALVEKAEKVEKLVAAEAPVLTYAAGKVEGGIDELTHATRSASAEEARQNGKVG